MSSRVTNAREGQAQRLRAVDGRRRVARPCVAIVESAWHTPEARTSIRTFMNQRSYTRSREAVFRSKSLAAFSRAIAIDHRTFEAKLLDAALQLLGGGSGFCKATAANPA